MIKELQRELKKHQNLIVDPKYNVLTNLRVKKVPNKNHVCPCNSGHRYRKCCEARDLVKKNEILAEIENYLKGEAPENKIKSGQMLFV
mgnify:CR=1 FL=1